MSNKFQAPRTDTLLCMSEHTETSLEFYVFCRESLYAHIYFFAISSPKFTLQQSRRIVPVLVCHLLREAWKELY
jgi:hypothetical protein